MNEDEALEDKLVNEEYKVWKKNSPFLYDLVMTQSLLWRTVVARLKPSSKWRSQCAQANTRDAHF